MDTEMFKMKLISKANFSLIDKGKIYYKNMMLKDYDFKKFKLGFIAINRKLNENNWIEFKICELDLQKSFLDYNTKKINMCCNLINNEADFKKELLYNLTHIYDLERRNINLSNCSNLVCMEIRKLNLSKKCFKKECFEQEIKNKFKGNVNCKNLTEIFDENFKKCQSDLSPILDYKFLFN